MGSAPSGARRPTPPSAQLSKPAAASAAALSPPSATPWHYPPPKQPARDQPLGHTHYVDCHDFLFSFCLGAQRKLRLWLPLTTSSRKYPLRRPRHFESCRSSRAVARPHAQSDRLETIGEFRSACIRTGPPLHPLRFAPRSGGTVAARMRTPRFGSHIA
jgi:hypothetical protein